MKDFKITVDGEEIADFVYVSHAVEYAQMMRQRSSLARVVVEDRISGRFQPVGPRWTDEDRQDAMRYLVGFGEWDIDRSLEQQKAPAV